MKKFEIFRPGRHTSSSGSTLDFSEADMRAAVAAYDPEVHEAPIVVGHPRDNGPAYGWVGALSFGESGSLEADPVQIDEAFAEMVAAGRFKKRSASWYLPNSANHPLAGSDKHGTYYLRHVGFLGAQPPAIKGLKEVSFSDSEEGVVEFDESSRWAWTAVASMVRGFREWIIGKDGVEAADKVVPNYIIADIDRKANESDAPSTADAMPAFNEKDDLMSKELQDRLAALTAENEALKGNQKPANFSELETSLAARAADLAAREAVIVRAGIETRVEAAVKAGRLLPSAKKQVVDFAMGLASAEATVDFGEGDKVVKVTQREAYLLQIEAAPKVVDYSERSGDSGAGSGNAADPSAVADKAREIQAKREKEGLAALSFTEAVAQATVELSGGAD